MEAVDPLVSESEQEESSSGNESDDEKEASDESDYSEEESSSEEAENGGSAEDEKSSSEEEAENDSASASREESRFRGTRSQYACLFSSPALILCRPLPEGGLVQVSTAVSAFCCKWRKHHRFCLRDD